jgi:hypothetical protein
MRLGSSKSLIGLGAAVGLLAAAGAWAQPNLPVVQADRQGLVVARAICAAVKNYTAVSTSVSSPPAASAKARDKGLPPEPPLSPDQYHAALKDPLRPLIDKCRLVLKHKRLACATSDLGGPLGWKLENATSEVEARLLCNGLDAPFSFDFPNVNFTVAVAPHSDEAEGQSFDTQMYSIEGVATNVPGFASIRLVGGSNNGYPSPGHTTLIPTGTEGVYVVDSTFTIGYRIEYVGAEGGPLEGGSGTIEGTATMKAYGP